MITEHQMRKMQTAKANHWQGDSWSTVEVNAVYDAMAWHAAGCPMEGLERFLIGYVVIGGETKGPFGD